MRRGSPPPVRKRGGPPAGSSAGQTVASRSSPSRAPQKKTAGGTGGKRPGKKRKKAPQPPDPEKERARREKEAARKRKRAEREKRRADRDKRRKERARVRRERRQIRAARRRARRLALLLWVQAMIYRFQRLVWPEYTRRLPKGKAVLVLVLNIVPFPGLGTVIYGKWERGVAQFLLTFVFLLGWLWAMLDGVRIVHKAFEPQKRTTERARRAGPAQGR